MKKRSTNRTVASYSLRATIKADRVIVTVIREYDGAILQKVFPLEFDEDTLVSPEALQDECKD